MKTITLTFESLHDVTVGKIQVDGQYIAPRKDGLPADLTEAERKICQDMCDLITRHTIGPARHNPVAGPLSDVVPADRL